ncbi:UNVERIFIED_CONTAM: hypothetical protein BEN50_13035 [Euhalothece sp. KZN 001]
MTNLKDFPETQSHQTDTGNGKTELPSLEAETPEKDNQKETSPTKKIKGATLQSRLLWGVLPTVLVPLVVAGGLGVQIIRENVGEQYRERLERQTLIAGESIGDVLETRLAFTKSLAKNPTVLDAVRQGSEKVIAENLGARSVRELEQQFNETRLLNPNPNLNNYLQEIVEAQGVSDIIITERFGMNVAYSQPTSDFVQKGEFWWDNAQGYRQNDGQIIGRLQYDDSVGTRQFSVSQLITNPETNEFLGVIRIGLPTSALETVERTLEHSGIFATGKVQVLNTESNQVFLSVGREGRQTQTSTNGGVAVEAFAAAMIENLEADDAVVQENLRSIAAAYDLGELEIEQHRHGEEGEQHSDSNTHAHEEEAEILRGNFTYQGRRYKLATVPDTNWVAISSVDESVLQAAGNELITVFSLIGALLSVGAVGVALLLARQFSSPLINVSQSAQKAAAGDLSARAQPQGTVETQALATSYNNLVERVQELLKEQEEAAEQQRQQREELEAEVSQLMDDIEQAADGDLTVRARLMEGDIGIVADLFNAVVENLQDTAQQVKAAASQVNSSLGENETSIRLLAEGAMEEVEEIQSSLNSVAEMNRSIKEVAENAQKATSIAYIAFNTAQEGNQAMDQTVASIQGLRSTVGETAKKMKQMGESAQKISQVVSLIDEISLKTSLLAINASVEANRAGELGQGFTAVAEQVEALAEQSASAAKEIAEIVASIQNETQDAIETMEQGTTEVVESTRSVEETKARLAEVVNRSEEINNLMQSISNSTISQAETSEAVSQLMEQVTKSSQDRSQTSREVAVAIEETAAVAKRLEESVAQFKVNK